MVAASTVPIFLYFILMWFYLGRCINVIDKPGLLVKSTLRLEIVVMLLILITFSFCCRWSCILQIKEKSYVALKPYIWEWRTIRDITFHFPLLLCWPCHRTPVRERPEWAHVRPYTSHHPQSQSSGIEAQAHKYECEARRGKKIWDVCGWFRIRMMNYCSITQNNTDLDCGESGIYLDPVLNSSVLPTFLSQLIYPYSLAGKNISGAILDHLANLWHMLVMTHSKFCTLE